MNLELNRDEIPDHLMAFFEPVPALKPKDACGIPWRCALALQSDGWYLRDAIIWAKAEVDDDDQLEGSAMPGSQRDRCTSAYETVFQLSKRPRYYYDHEGCKTKSGAMLRNVWRINPESYKGAHFATFPRELARRAIALGTSERGVCPACGAGWVRVVERGDAVWHQRPSRGFPGRPNRGCGDLPVISSSTLGWTPACNCCIICDSHGGSDRGSCQDAHEQTTGHRLTPYDPVPATVLDPFIGSGTSIVVANALGRNGIGLDLSAEYLSLARRRNTRPHAAVPRTGRQETHPLFDRDDVVDSTFRP